MNRKLGVINLGCSKNLVDTEMMVGILAKAGYELTEDLSTAQIIIINTCTFIDPARKNQFRPFCRQPDIKRREFVRNLSLPGV